MRVTFRWRKSPDGIINAMDDYERKALVAIRAVGEFVGQKMQDEGRQNAPWQDRTGNARSGLFYAVDGLGDSPIVGQVRGSAKAESGGDTATVSGDDKLMIIAFSHTVFYGKFLETSHGGRHAIIMSTIEKNLPELEKLLDNLLEN